MAVNSNEVEQVVARTLRDSLAKLQQTTRELDQAVADLVSACASARPSNSLPSMMRARSAAASLAASLEVLSKFVVTALQSASPVDTELLATLPRPVAPGYLREPTGLTERAPQARVALPEPPATEPSTDEHVPPAESSRLEAVAPVAARTELPVFQPSEPPILEPSTIQPPPPAESLIVGAPAPVAVQAEPPNPQPTAAEPVPAPGSFPLEDAAFLAAKTEPLTPDRPVLEPVASFGSQTAESIDAPESVTVRPEMGPATTAPPRPGEFKVSTESEAPELPLLEQPVFEPTFPTAFEEAAVEPPGLASTSAGIESTSKEETAEGVVADLATQTAELYELATWKEPHAPSASQALEDATAPEVPTPEAVVPAVPAQIEIPIEIGGIENAEPAAIEVNESAEAAPPLATSIPLSASILVQELPPEAKGFDVLALSADQQELHRRANRVAKVSMQDVKMLRPRDVALGKEQKDICVRLREDIEKAHKEYDRRFHAILDHPVDYFYDWMVEILGDGDPETLGEYPYPSPVLRR